MNTRSYPTQRRATAEECVGIGDFIFNAERDYLYIVLPNALGSFSVDSIGRAALDPIRITRLASTHPRVWTWNGDEESPTLSPSIDWSDNWHGYLVAGQLTSC